MLSVAASLIILVVAIVINPDLYKFVVRPEVQVVLGTIVVAVLLFDNVVSGLILGIALLTMFLRVYAKMYGINIGLDTLFGVRDNSILPTKTRSMEYVTAKHLEDAQDNIINKGDYKKEMIGVRGVYGEAVYGAQGIGEQMPGYDSYAPGSTVKP